MKPTKDIKRHSTVAMKESGPTGNYVATRYDLLWKHWGVHPCRMRLGHVSTHMNRDAAGRALDDIGVRRSLRIILDAQRNSCRRGDIFFRRGQNTMPKAAAPI